MMAEHNRNDTIFDRIERDIAAQEEVSQEYREGESDIIEEED